MRITESQLRNVIRKELKSVLFEVSRGLRSEFQYDNYFRRLYEYLKAQPNKTAKVENFSYEPNEWKNKFPNQPVPPYADDSNIKAVLYNGAGNDPIYSLTLNPKEKDETKQIIVNFYTKDRVASYQETTLADIRNKYAPKPGSL